MVKRPAFYLDTQACTGCKTCMVACKDRNDLPLGVRWRRVTEFTGGEWFRRADGTFTQEVFSYYLSVGCNHCENPVCVRGCPSKAMTRAADGIVTVDPDRCLGCRYCEWACPYSAPQFDPEMGRMTKCDFCRDELTKGNEPACVAACPTRALRFGEATELAAGYGPGALPAPLPPPEITEPRLIVEPHRKARPIDSRTGLIANPEEVRDE